MIDLFYLIWHYIWQGLDDIQIGDMVIFVLYIRLRTIHTYCCFYVIYVHLCCVSSLCRSGLSSKHARSHRTVRSISDELWQTVAFHFAGFHDGGLKTGLSNMGLEKCRESHDWLGSNIRDMFGHRIEYPRLIKRLTAEMPKCPHVVESPECLLSLL